jgi:hypothetical protein
MTLVKERAAHNPILLPYKRPDKKKQLSAISLLALCKDFGD